MIYHQLSSYIRGVFYYLFYRIRFYPKIITARLFKNRQNVHIAINDITYDLKVNISEGGIAEDLFICSIREYPNVYHFHEYLKKNALSIDTYLDIGANIGYYAILAAKTLRLSSKNKKNLIFIEPIQTTFKQFQENLQLNSIQNTENLNIAIGDKDGTASMIETKEKNFSRVESFLEHPVGTQESIQTVTMKTPQTLFKDLGLPLKNVIFRCDIEGYEYELFAKNRLFFKSLHNAHLIMELHPFYLGPKKGIELFKTLEQSGYVLEKVISCEPLYFLKMPKVIRKFLNKLFLDEYNGEILGALTSTKSFKVLIQALADRKNPIYFYPNLHIYASKA